VQAIKAQTPVVWAVALTPDGKRVVATGAVDGPIRIWDLATGTCLDTLIGHTDRVDAIAVTPDGKRVISGSFDKTVRVWDLIGAG
jgi:WD40 repeat protein